MRIALVVLGILLFTVAAHAESDFSVSIGANSCESDYSYGVSLLGSDGWFSHHRHQRGFNRGGLSIGYRDGDWSARIGAGSSYYNPNDRGGYRVFIPQGRQGREYYGGGSHNYYSPSHGYGGCNDYGYCSHGWYGGCSSCSGGTVVIPYGYNSYSSYYSRPFYNEPIWTAPDNYDYGYYNEYANEPRWADSGRRSLYEEPQQPMVYNDNRTYNYYGEESSAARPQSGSEQQSKDSRPVQHDPQDGKMTKSKGGPVATRFTQQAEIELGDGSWQFEVNDGRLTAASGAGPGFAIAEGVDGSKGIFALNSPNSGLTLVFRQGEQLVAARPGEKGKWSVDPLPYSVDFSQQLSSGAIGGNPWVVFNDLSGTRYVVGFDENGWYEVGSGSR